MKNAVEICEPYFERLAETGTTNVQVLGGVGSAVLTKPELDIDFAGKRMRFNGELFLPQFRDGGSKRDLDVLVLTADQTEVDAAETTAAEVISDDLELSFFGLKSYGQLVNIDEHPRSSTIKSFLADRYVTTDGQGQIVGLQKALYPFATTVDPASLETWTLEIGGREVPVPHPGVSILNYATRSISGLRPKDAEKVNDITTNVLGKSWEVHEWMVEGPGKGLYDFARLLQGLRTPNSAKHALLIGHVYELGIPPASDEEIASHTKAAEALGNLSPRQLRNTIRLARLKSRVLHGVEGNERIVAFWQNHFENSKAIDNVVKNN